jgi:hypothetical protein
MSLSEIEVTKLRICIAILTRNRRELDWAVTQPIEVVGSELVSRVREVLAHAPIPGSHKLLKITNYLPARLQFLGQRLILIFPRIAHRLLRRSGIHHQMF